MLDPRKIDPEVLYTERESSSLIGKSVASLQRYRWAGIGPRYAKHGRSVFYRGRDLIGWLEAGAVEPTAAA